MASILFHGFLRVIKVTLIEFWIVVDYFVTTVNLLNRDKMFYCKRMGFYNSYNVCFYNRQLKKSDSVYSKLAIGLRM